MQYPVKLAEEAGGVHDTLKLPGPCGSISAVRSEGLSAAVQIINNIDVIILVHMLYLNHYQ